MGVLLMAGKKDFQDVLHVILDIHLHPWRDYEQLTECLVPHYTPTINFAENLTGGSVKALALSGAQMRSFWRFGG